MSQTSPAFCCPDLVTEAMAGQIEQKTGTPMVSITYNGTGGKKKEAITFPISNIREKIVSA